MTLDDYAAWAEKIDSKATTGGRDRLLSYLALRLAREAGEVANEVKKLLRGGALNTDHTIEELGDAMYY